MKEENLVFIISQPRSGSTYLQNLLSNNEITNTCSEPWILLNFPNLLNPNLVQASFDNELAVRAFKNYKDKFKDFKLDELQKKFLLDLYSPLGEGFEFVIDKTPRYWEVLQEIRQLFPQSKIILLKRHPVDVAKSIIKAWNFKSLYDLLPYKRDLILAPQVLLNCERKFSEDPNFYFIKYETLTSNLIKETEKIYDWIGIPFDSSILDISKNMKTRGEFGDPYQNSEKGYLEIKAEKDSFIFSSLHEEFLKGYANFLGREFLLQYGYSIPKGIRAKTTVTFSRYIHLDNEYRTRRTWNAYLHYLFNRVSNYLKL